MSTCLWLGRKAKWNIDGHRADVVIHFSYVSKPPPGGGGGGAWWRPSRTATAVGSTHPTGMQSCRIILEQESIPVRCVPSACQPYPVVSQIPCLLGDPSPWTYLPPWTYPPSWTHPPTLDIPTHPLEGTWHQRYPPYPRKDGTRDTTTPPHGQTDTCEKNTFPQFRLRVVKIALCSFGVSARLRNISVKIYQGKNYYVFLQ